MYSNKELNHLNWARILPFHCNWQITERAAVYSDELFQEAYLNFSETYSYEKLEDDNHLDHISKFYEDLREKLEENLPEQIKNKVSDLRVLTCGYLTKDVYEDLMSYSKEADQKLALIEKENYDNYQEALTHLSEEARWVMERSFHDSRLLDCGYQDGDIFLLLKLDVGIAPLVKQYLKLIFKDAVVIEGTISKELECWLQEELYFDEEININIHFSAGDVLISSKDIKGEYCYSFFASDTELSLLEQPEIIAGRVMDLIEDGKMTLEEAMNHPLCESMGIEAFKYMSIILSGNIEDLMKLTVTVPNDLTRYRALTNKKYIYEIDLVNAPQFNIEDGSVSWLRGEELLQYIRSNCRSEIELWVVWTDCLSWKEEICQLNELKEDYLRSLYNDDDQGVLASKKIIIHRE